MASHPQGKPKPPSMAMRKQAARPLPAVKKGKLWKLSRGKSFLGKFSKNWAERMFEADPDKHVLTYWDLDGNLKGSMPIFNPSVSTVESSRPNAFKLTGHTEDGKPDSITLSADSEETGLSWIGDLRTFGDAGIIRQARKEVQEYEEAMNSKHEGVAEEKSAVDERGTPSVGEASAPPASPNLEIYSEGSKESTSINVPPPPPKQAPPPPQPASSHPNQAVGGKGKKDGTGSTGSSVSTTDGGSPAVGSSSSASAAEEGNVLSRSTGGIAPALGASSQAKVPPLTRDESGKVVAIPQLVTGPLEDPTALLPKPISTRGGTGNRRLLESIPQQDGVPKRLLVVPGSTVADV